MSSLNRFTSTSDERTGRWTRVEFHEDQVVFLPSRPKPHWLAVALGLPILILILGGAIRDPLVAAFFILCVTWSYIGLRRYRQNQLPVVISKTPIDDVSGQCYSVGQIRQFLIRENSDRDSLEDPHLLQIYLELENQEQLVLLYQDYHNDNRNKVTRAVFEQLLQWHNTVR